MRVVTQSPEPMGLAATIFFWPADEAAITPAAAAPLQDLSDFIENNAKPCLVDTYAPSRSVRATQMARCLYTCVEQEFNRAPRGLAVTNADSLSDRFLSPRGHLFQIDRPYTDRYVDLEYTVWCLF